MSTFVEPLQPQFDYALDGKEYPCMYLENGHKLRSVGPFPCPLSNNKVLSGSCVYFGPGDDTAPLLRLSGHPHCREFIYVDSHPESHYGSRGGEHLEKFLQRMLMLLKHHHQEESGGGDGGNNSGDVTMDMIEEEKHYLFHIGEAKTLHYFLNTPSECIQQVPSLVELLQSHAEILWMHGYSPPTCVFECMPRLHTVISTSGALYDEDDRPLPYYDCYFPSLTVSLVLIHETEFDDMVGKYFYHQDIENNFVDDEEDDDNNNNEGEEEGEEDDNDDEIEGEGE